MSVEHDSATPPLARTVPAVFGSTKVSNDPVWEWEFAVDMKRTYSPLELLALYSRYRSDDGRLNPSFDV